MPARDPDARVRPLRVAVLDHTAELGGAELALERVLAALDPVRVHPVVVLFTDGPLGDRLRAAGHEVVVVPLDPRLRDTDRFAGAAAAASPRRALAAAGFARRLAATVRRLDVDVVHTTSLKADLAGALLVPLVPLAPLGRPALVWHVHDRLAPDYLPGRTAGLLRALARRVPRAVVVNSLATAATLPGARGLRVVHPGLAPDQLAAAPRTAQPQGPPVVVMVGRLSPTKGQLVLVRAARRVLDARPDVRFRVVGAAAFGAEDYARRVHEEVRRLHLEDALELVGFTDDPGSELRRASVAVHASTVPEPFGQVVTEAMAAGVPVVAAAGGGVDEVVRTGPEGHDTGLLTPAGDDAALAAAVLRTLDHPAEALERAGRAHADVASRFLADASAEGLTRVWEWVGSTRTAHPAPDASLA